MEVVLLILGIACLLIGLAGAVLPLPGPPLSFGGILLLHFSDYAQFSDNLLFWLGAATVLITVLDYYVPIWGTKKFGGSKYGVTGSFIGMLAGLFMGPFGIFIGAFAGAFLGEMLNENNFNKAFKAALGSFIGFLVGIFAKVTLCLVMIFYAGSQLYNHFNS
ncbi:DUF456 family protein [Emticicia sp. CRIBPO]|uniref:DUF456 domain-containing protein n=1 Tax=Emticicia sp. CRIBPO TaxID=2683258 RepID=UPI0014132B5E|nr:DUF456 domain-containing protein [Emticicia sp. CRIBPO]NBA85693.1 DUF456 family protein [Emticicia sp. CRIBPO]